MSRELYACQYAREFPLQALLRLRPDLRGKPIAVLEGRAPLETICSINRAAVQAGVVTGMTRLEAERINGLLLLPRSPESEAAARAVFLECVANFSPRIEAIDADTHCACVLDIAGTERLFGAPAALAERMREALAGVGFRVSIAVSANFETALLKAAATNGISIIAEGEEAAALGPLPVDSLEMDAQSLEIWQIWGIRTLGELALLPEGQLIARLGQAGKRWREIASGRLPHLFQPIEAQFTLQEFCEFEHAVEQIDSVLFIGARMIDSLVTRAAGRALSLALLKVEMRLEGGRSHQLTLRPAVPSADRKFLLKLLQIELGSHPPPAAIIALTITAEAGPRRHSAAWALSFATAGIIPARCDAGASARTGGRRQGRLAGAGRLARERRFSRGGICNRNARRRDCRWKAAHGVAPHTAAASRARALRRSKARRFPRRPAGICNCHSLWPMASERLLVGRGRVGQR